MFDFIEEAFDEVALAVDCLVDGALNLSVALCGDMGDRPDGLDSFNKGFGVIASVSHDMVCPRQACDQVGRSPFV